MAKKPHWEITAPKNGACTVDLSDWKYFDDFIYKNLLYDKTYVFRGHRRADWKLESTLDRDPAARLTRKRREHLDAFMFAVRGRRGSNPATLVRKNEWWALGQHHGLKTPLLDWTKSPFVAAYFAFIEDEKNNASVARHTGCLYCGSC